MKTQLTFLLYLYLPRATSALPRLLLVLALGLALLGAIEYSLVGAGGPLHLLADDGTGGGQGGGGPVEPCPPGTGDCVVPGARG